MGQVWQATDTQLNRQVALKIRPDAFADDPERLARFTREAQILASLNHPNIAAIHGIEEDEGTRALVPSQTDRWSRSGTCASSLWSSERRWVWSICLSPSSISLISRNQPNDSPAGAMFE